MKLFKFLHLGCKEATLRCMKQHEEPLSFAARIQLKLHLLICKPCLEFSRQIQFIHQSILKFSNYEEISFSEAQKKVLQEKVDSNT